MLATVFLLAGAVLTLIVPLFEFDTGSWANNYIPIYIKGVSTFGTVILATLTVLTLLNNQTERKKPIMRDMLRRIVWPAAEVARKDREKWWADSTNWVESEGKTTLKNPQVNLAPILEDVDPVAAERFRDRFTEEYQDLQRYDAYLTQFASAIENVVCDSYEPLRAYYSRNDSHGGNTSMLVQMTLNRILHEKVTKDPEEEDNIDESKDGLRNRFELIVEYSTEGRFNELDELGDLVFEQSISVTREMAAIREDVEITYNIVREE